jgi:hypothetical protein
MRAYRGAGHNFSEALLFTSETKHFCQRFVSELSDSTHREAFSVTTKKFGNFAGEAVFCHETIQKGVPP